MKTLRNKYVKVLVATVLVLCFIASFMPANVFAGERDARNRIGGKFDSESFEDYKEGDDVLYFIITKKAKDGKPGEVGVNGFTTDKETVKKVVLPKTVEYIGCTYNVTSIERFAFAHSVAEEVIIHEGIKKIRTDAFLYSKLKRIHIPKTVTTLGNTVFAYCYYLEEITVDEENPKYCAEDGFLFTKSKKTLIATKVFNDECVIPKPVQTIRDYALSNCNFISERTRGTNIIRRITFPSTVKKIGEGNLNAYALVFKGKAPKITDNAQSYNFAFVPKKYVDNYKALTYNGESVFQVGDVTKVMYRSKYYSANVKFMKALNPDDYIAKQSSTITKKAKAITKGLETDYEKALAITLFVNDEIYQDHGALTLEMFDNSLAKPEYVLEKMQGGTNGVCNLVTALCNAVGIPCLTISPDANSGGYSSMLYNLAYVNDEWIVIDTFNGSSIIYYMGKYYNKSCQTAFFNRDLYTYSFYHGMHFYHYFDETK